jgi:hypothetical protein
MQSVGQTARNFVRKVPAAEPDKVIAASYARMKQAWALQVASDRRLPGTALRIALAWPKYLNAKSLLAWPAQETLAIELNTTDRSIREGLKALEDHGHLKCISRYRGGRHTNRYRIILDNMMLTTTVGTVVPCTPEQAFRAKGNVPSGVTGADVPGCGDAAFRGTPERTPERTLVAESAMGTPGGSPVTAGAAQALMAEVFGPGRVNEGGHLQG